jgi:multiple sugar transport system substrate-binding protein
MKRTGQCISELDLHATNNLHATNRREFLKKGGTALAGLSVITLAGCGSSSSNGSKAGTGDIAIGMTSDLPPAFTAAGQKDPFTVFNAQHKFKVKYVEENSDTDTYLTNIRTQLRAGTDVVDVVAGDVSWGVQFAPQGWLADLSSKFPPSAQADFLPSMIQSCTWNGKIYGVPFYMDDGYLFYRKDLLEKSGYSAPPQTWSELQEMAQKVMRDQKIKYGFTFTGANYEGGTLLGMEFVKTSGGTITDGKTVTATSPQAIEGLTIERSMITKGISPEAVADYQEPNAEAPFIAGDAVFLRNWTYEFEDIANPKGTGSGSKIHPSQVGVAPIPRASTSISPVNVGGGWNLYVNANSPNQESAWELIQYITSPAQQATTFEAIQYNPTRISVLNNAQLAAKFPFSALNLAKAEVMQTITPPRSPYYKDMSTLMAAQFNAMLRGAQTPHQTAENVQSGLEKIVSQSV